MTYRAPHRCQYDYSPTTASSGCTWTSATTGADNATGGAYSKNPDQVHGLVGQHEETNPATPGWSLGDVDKAMSRAGVLFENRSAEGWGKLVQLRNQGKYIILQGDSDRFPGGCSGDFNGDHAIGIHPDNNADGEWRIDDPICPRATYEPESVLRAYAQKLSSSVLFGVFTTPVPSGDTGGGETMTTYKSYDDMDHDIVLPKAITKILWTDAKPSSDGPVSPANNQHKFTPWFDGRMLITLQLQFIIDQEGPDMWIQPRTIRYPEGKPEDTTGWGTYTPAKGKRGFYIAYAISMGVGRKTPLGFDVEHNIPKLRLANRVLKFEHLSG